MFLFQIEGEQIINMALVSESKNLFDISVHISLCRYHCICSWYAILYGFVHQEAGVTCESLEPSITTSQLEDDRWSYPSPPASWKTHTSFSQESWKQRITRRIKRSVKSPILLCLKSSLSGKGGLPKCQARFSKESLLTLLVRSGLYKILVRMAEHSGGADFHWIVC